MAGFRILQWNARSAIANKGVLQQELWTRKIAVAAISETWFKPDSVVRFRGYQIYRQDREDGRGGVALLINNGLYHTPVQICHDAIDSFQATAARLSTPIGRLTVVVIYSPPRSYIPLEEWYALVQQLEPPFLFCGDFNAHNRLWGCAHNDRLGDGILEFLDEFNLILLNDGSPTLFSLPGQRPSAIDLSLCSASLHSCFKWTTLPYPMGSNHYAILISTHVATPITAHKPSRKWNVKQADWSRYAALMDDQLSAFPTEATPQARYTIFQNCINVAASHSIPQKRTMTGTSRSPVPWWDPECSRRVAQRRLACSRFKRHTTWETYIDYKRIDASTKRFLKARKKEHWMKFCEQLSVHTPVGRVWSMVNSLKRKPVPPKRLQPWIDEFADIVAPPTVTTEPIGFAETGATDNLREGLSTPFSIFELQKALRPSSDTAPGYDQIHYSMVRNLSDTAKGVLVNIFNDIWRDGNVPDDWKTQILVPILKPGKDPGHATSYRPIALSSCMCKIFERLLKLRLEWWLEHETLLPRTQNGFRKGRSTHDNITLLAMDIEKTFFTNGYLTALFLDFSRAYDNVLIPELIHKLQRLHLPVVILRIIHSLLGCRTVYIRDQDNELYGPRLVFQGLPQGAILSPLLYSLYVADLETLFSPTVKVLQYADDVCIYAHSPCFWVTRLWLIDASERLAAWETKNGLALSSDKSVVVIFTRKRNNYLSPELQLGPYTFPVRSNAKFLGVYFDCKLTWSRHVTYLIDKVDNTVNILRMLARVWWGAEPIMLLTLYKVLIRSVLDYGSIVYGNATQLTLRKLDVFHYRVIRLVLGAMKTTPTNALLVEAAAMPLSIRRQMLADNFLLSRASISDSALLTVVVQFWRLTQASHGRRMNRLPLLVRSYEKWHHLFSLLLLDTKLPCFNSSFDLFFHPVPVSYMPSDYRTGTDINRDLEHFLNIHWPQYAHIYTDGSKSEAGVGYAFFSPTSGIYQMYALPPESSIYTAELLAIREAIRYGVRTFKFILVLTDSQSVLQKLQHPTFDKQTNRYVLEVLEAIKDAQNLGIVVHLFWIKGHHGILHNETVDRLAKRSITEGQLRPTPIPYTDLISTIRKAAYHTWNQEWHVSQNCKGGHLAVIQPNVSSRPWFASVQLSRRHVTSIIRMRLGHGCYPAHLHRLKIILSGHCEKDSEAVADLNHIILACSKYTTAQSDLYKKLVARGYPLPTSVPVLLHCFDQYKYTLIADYLKAADLKI